MRRKARNYSLPLRQGAFLLITQISWKLRISKTPANAPQIQYVSELVFAMRKIMMAIASLLTNTANIKFLLYWLVWFFICGVVVNRRSHRYASFLRLAAEEIILRQYSRNLIFAVLMHLRQFSRVRKTRKIPTGVLTQDFTLWWTESITL